MKPTVGRIVHYQSYGTPGGEYGSYAHAAIITSTATEGNIVSLAVMNPTGVFFDPMVRYSETPKAGCWSWPPLDKAATTPVETKYVTLPKLPSMPPAEFDSHTLAEHLCSRVRYLNKMRAADNITQTYVDLAKLIALDTFVRGTRDAA
jgi:hypothetical protein